MWFMDACIHVCMHACMYVCREECDRAERYQKICEVICARDMGVCAYIHACMCVSRNEKEFGVTCVCVCMYVLYMSV